MLATVITVVVTRLVSDWRFVRILETAALVLFLGDELPDISFSGVTPNITSLASAFRTGFNKYISLIWGVSLIHRVRVLLTVSPVSLTPPAYFFHMFVFLQLP